MKKYLFTFCIALITTAAMYAQRPTADEITTSKGSLTIQPVNHASIVFKWNNQTIYVDPYDDIKLYEGLPAPDFIFITDIHPDHLDLKTLNALDTKKAMIIIPQAAAEKLPDNLKSKSLAVANGQTVPVKDITITAIPMYNLPELDDNPHPRGRGNGYVLTLGGKKIYISGDTEDTYEMRHLEKIDVAFVCMNLPYTMAVEQAADAVLEFKPAVVYPYHYRGKDGLSDTKAFEKLVNDGNKEIEVRLRNWYPENK